MNHQLITEVAKTTAATLMLLASSPSRLTDLKVDSFTDGTRHGVVDAEPGEGRHRLHRRVWPAGQAGRAADARDQAERGLSNVAPGTSSR